MRAAMVTLQFCEHCHSSFKAPLQIFCSAAVFLDMPVRPEDPLPGLKMATAWLHEKDVDPDW